jgi:hypothetical protein
MFYLSSHLPVWQCAHTAQCGHRVEVGPNWVKAIWLQCVVPFAVGYPTDLFVEASKMHQRSGTAQAGWHSHRPQPSVNLLALW